MKSASVHLSAALVLLAAATARPAAAQECIGAPLQGGTFVTLGEVARAPTLTVIGARAGREVGEWLAVHVDAARLDLGAGAIGYDDWLQGYDGNGNRIGASAVLHFAPGDVSLCSFASVRRTDVRTGLQYGPAFAAESPYWQHSTTGLAGFLGVAAGSSVDIAAEWMVVPSASFALGAMQNEIRGRCIRSCGEGHPANSPFSESGLQLEAEIGSLLRFRRLFAGGALRWVHGDFDPSLQREFSVDANRARFMLVRAGVTF